MLDSPDTIRPPRPPKKPDPPNRRQFLLGATLLSTKLVLDAFLGPNKAEAMQPNELALPPETSIQRAERLIQEHIKRVNAETKASVAPYQIDPKSSFYAVNEKGVEIAVNADRPFELWSLNSIPLCLLFFEKSKADPAKYSLDKQVSFGGKTQSIKEIMTAILQRHDQDAVGFLASYITDENTWDKSAPELLDEYRSLLGMGNATIYDQKNNVFFSTPREMGRIMRKLYEPAYQGSASFISDVLHSPQPDNGSRVSSFREKLTRKGASVSDLIGNGFSQLEGASYHDMGSIEGPSSIDGQYFFVSMNSHQNDNITPVNSIEEFAVMTSLPVLLPKSGY